MPLLSSKKLCDKMSRKIGFIWVTDDDPERSLDDILIELKIDGQPVNLTVMTSPPVTQPGGPLEPEPEPGPESLLEPGETLGGNLVPVAWGSYDSGNTQVASLQSATGIKIEYQKDAGNQQVWKVIPALIAGDYILRVKVSANIAKQYALNLIQHAAPYGLRGHSAQHFTGETVLIRLTLPAYPNETRLQFIFSGTTKPDTYTIANVGFWKVNQ